MLTPDSFPQKYIITGQIVHGAKGGHHCSLRDQIGGLSPRQKEAVELAAAGKTNKEIAAALGVTVDTAKVHLRQAMLRLGVHRRQHLAPLAASSATESPLDASGLTPREVEILAQVAAGETDKEIARRFGLTTSDIKTAMRRIRRAAGGGTRTKAAVAFLAAHHLSVTARQEA